MKKAICALLYVVLFSLLASNNANAGYTWKLIDYWYEGTYIHCQYVNYYNGSTYVWYHHRKYGCAGYRN